MHVFYTPDLTNLKELPAEEAKHCLRVLRLTEGTSIELIDGKGTRCQAVIHLTDKNHCWITLKESTFIPSSTNNRVHIAIAPTKNMDRTEWFLEKGTEIGLDSVCFLKCRYSERKNINEERIEKILIAAMKQSHNTFLPTYTPLRPFLDFIKTPFEGQKFIAHCYEDPNKQSLKTAYQKGERALILIGPEGDFSTEEVTLAKEQGFIPISLSSSRLRTETAALVACHTINLLNENN